MTARIIKDETIWDGHIGLHRLTIKQSDVDSQAKTLIREVAVSPAGAVILLRRGRNGPIILTRQLRAPVLFNKEAPSLIECCAGNLDGSPPTSADAMAEAERSARREAEEETGWRVDTIRHLFTLYVSPGVSSEKLYFFVGICNERIGSGGGLADEGEAIETLEVTLAQAWTMVTAGEIQDMKTVLLLQHLLIERVSAGDDGSAPPIGDIGPAPTSS